MTSSPDYQEVIDPRDKQRYRAVKLLDGKLWLVENLRFDAQGSIGVDEGLDEKEYGRLYNWKLAKQAPLPGWIMPTKSDWENLFKAYGNSPDALAKSGFRIQKLKLWDEGYFQFGGTACTFWSSTQPTNFLLPVKGSAYMAKFGPIKADDTGASDYGNIGAMLFSECDRFYTAVRCIR